MNRSAHQTFRGLLAATATVLLIAQSAYPMRIHIGGSHESAYRSAAESRTLTSANAGSTTYGISRRRNVAVKSGNGVIATLKRGARVSVLERESGRLKVRLSDGKTGWVESSSMRIGDDRKPLPAGDSWAMRSSITRTACSYRGARYVRGGTSASGFDCSGFVKFLYAKHGVKLPHSSRAQYGCGKAVSKSALQPGDIVFFGGTYRRGISHVGLYLGAGKFIHASTERGGVRVDELNSAYYRRKYAGARRVR